MASKNILQLIEKEVWKKVPQGTWNNDDIDLREDGNEETYFENSFTEVKNHGPTNDDPTSKAPNRNVDFDSSEKSSVKNILEYVVFVPWEELSKETPGNTKDGPSRLQCSPSSEPNKEIEKSKESSADEDNEKNIDEVDYFDSDEEYMETHGLRYDEKDILDPLQEDSSEPLRSRYSKGVEQYRNIPVYRRSIQIFARDNEFEIYDVIPDGNCMFRAIADQFMINGRIGYSAERLRCTAIEYLRKHPYKEDGNHIQSFLCTESWEDYLSRMSTSSEWSDHIVLQAVVDAYNLEVVIFNVFQDDIRRTEVHPENRRNRKQMLIFLGHLGEFHYLSLRPAHWTSTWPYRSALYRLLACSYKMSPAARQELIQNKIIEMGASDMVNQEFLDMVHILPEGREKLTDPEKSSKKKHAHSSESHGEKSMLAFDTFCFKDLQLQESEDSLNIIFYDPMHIDTITGIPLPHLSYILKQLFPRRMINSYFGAQCPQVFSGVFLHCIGSSADGINVFLKDISKKQTKRSFYNRHKQKKGREFVLIPLEKVVRHSDITEYQTSVESIFADSSKTHPGYCHLRLSPYTKEFERNVLQKESEKFLMEIDLDAAVSIPGDAHVKYKGLVCETFPPSTEEWRIRERKFTFPSRQLIQNILRGKCTLIKKAHPYSKVPDIEWKYNFSLAEYTIFTTGLTGSQIHGFCVIKVLVENMTFHLTKQLKNKHLKAVYLRALEEIPCAAWETNFSGCILFIISNLVDNLKAKFLPHYFIPSNNLIECYSAEEIKAICVNVECIRMFPVAVTQIIAENHGYHHASKVIRLVFANCKSFMHNKDLTTVFINAFTPGTLCSIKVMTRLGFYDTAFQLLQYVHEQMLLIPMPTECYEIPSFLEFFHMALKSLRQKSSRIILAKYFDIQFKTDILKEHIDDDATYTKNILPWKVDFEIGLAEVPKEKTRDFSSLADFFYAYSSREFEKKNSTLSVLAIEIAILCIKKAINTDTIRMEEIEDGNLKEEILSQKDRMVRNLKKKLEICYKHMYAISLQYLTFKPLQDHMDDIEKLCDELPEMALCVSRMFRYLKREEKASEYEHRYTTAFKRKHAYLSYDF
ncbi:uncharacterized protein LOC133187978 [Saccostrea echinata]|uniref:uncharacterized protein LOC133187978 n=1 Tax=Saccostrea echinata TaxID=191078 RepID=UPI002A832592|nr:uncharacterized protein LOC133187978 [Saccostrea echinata]